MYTYIYNYTHIFCVCKNIYVGLYMYLINYIIIYIYYRYYNCNILIYTVSLTMG